MSSSPASLSARLAPAAVYELNDRQLQCSGRTAAAVEIPEKQRTPPSRWRCPASVSVSVSGSAQPWPQATRAPGPMYRARSSAAASPTSSVTPQPPAYPALSSVFISLPASLRGR